MRRGRRTLGSARPRASAARAAQPAKRPGETEMPDGVRGLGPQVGLQVGHEVKRAAVIAPVAVAAQRDDAQRVVAAAEAARDDVRRVDPRRAVARQAAQPGDLRALGLAMPASTTRAQAASCAAAASHASATTCARAAVRVEAARGGASASASRRVLERVAPRVDDRPVYEPVATPQTFTTHRPRAPPSLLRSLQAWESSVRVWRSRRGPRSGAAAPAWRRRASGRWRACAAA